jgi:hypothetical protein
MSDSHVRLADAAARRAAEREEMLTPKARRRRFWKGVRDVFAGGAGGVAVAARWSWRNAPTGVRGLAEFVGFCLALGALGVLTAWEANNSGKGWQLLFAGWGALAWWAGAAIPAWAIWSHRQFAEHRREANELRDRDQAKEARLANARSRKWLASAVACVAMTLFGVFSNMVSHAALDAEAASELAEDRTLVRATIRRLEREKSVMPKPDGVEFDRETLAGYLAEAAGWKMDNLDPDGACKADLRPRQRDLCNLSVTVRAEIAEAEEMQRRLDAKQAEIDAEVGKLDDLKPVAGSKHYERMADLLNTFAAPGGEIPPAAAEDSVLDRRGVSATQVQTWGIFLMAVFGLLVCMWGWDSLGEKVESRRKPAPSQPKAEAT